MTADPYSQTKKALLALGGQRVWSLMVTLFGDLAQAPGTAIDGPVLSALMAEMDTRPEAVRVALHRLRNDGWIASEKIGRMRRHSLTAKSRAESARASTRIYAAPATATDAAAARWCVALTESATHPTAEAMAARGFAALMPRVYVGAAEAIAPEDALTLSGGAAPGWLRQEIGAALPGDEYAALLPTLRSAEAALPPDSLTPLQQAVLRCLIVHSWRRIVLRHPDLPATLLPTDWPGAACHAHVHRLLDRFPRPALSRILSE